MYLKLSFFCAAIVASSLAGGLAPLATALTHTRLQIYLSFSAGAMLGAAFLHMIPEAARLGSPGATNWTAAGLLTLFLVERYFAFHHHESRADPGDPCPSEPHAHAHSRGHAAGIVNEAAPGGVGVEAKGGSLSWGFAAIGLTIHSLVGGVALASACAADRSSGHSAGQAAWSVFLATVLHKPADALTIVTLGLRGGVAKKSAHLLNLGFSLMVPVGAALFILGADRFAPASLAAVSSRALAFSAGTFLCVALSDLLPELQFHSHDRLKLTIALLAGFGLMAIVD